MPTPSGVNYLLQFLMISSNSPIIRYQESKVDVQILYVFSLFRLCHEHNVLSLDFCCKGKNIISNFQKKRAKKSLYRQLCCRGRRVFRDDEDYELSTSSINGSSPRYLSKSLWNSLSCTIRYFSNSVSACSLASSAVTLPGF